VQEGSWTTTQNCSTMTTFSIKKLPILFTKLPASARYSCICC
jgi:hypothetical protein